MKDYRNILVIVDPSLKKQKAVLRAIEFAEKIIATENILADDITITAFCAVYDFSFEVTTFLSEEENLLMTDSVVEHQKQQWVFLRSNQSQETLPLVRYLGHLLA